MAYDEALAARVREHLKSKNPEEKKLFGGLTFKINDKMVCSVNSQGFTLRMGSRTQEVLGWPNVKPKMMGPKPMNGMVVAEVEAYKSDEGLAKLLDAATEAAEAGDSKPKAA